MEPPLLQLNHILKSFGAVRALKGVSFSLRPGEVHALLGENGAGKSTLIKVIAGAHSPDGGEIVIDGERLSHLTPRLARHHGIACIYQQPALFPDLTVAENIALGVQQPKFHQRMRWGRQTLQARELLKRVGAKIEPNAEVRSLSMPEQQLVEIAKALGAGARILIMDEPTASLTRQEVELLLAVVRDLRTQGVGIIYISHRLEEIFAVADRVTVLRDGESVGTEPVAGMDEATLIQRMVGRRVSAIYPPSESEPGPVVLALSGVTCRASGVRDIDLDVRAGEVVGLSGLVGAGRTELARILFGITPADAGEIQLFGKAVRIQSPQAAVEHGIAYVPEDRRKHGVILDMPIAANLTMAVWPTFFPGAWLRPEAERLHALEFIRDLGIKTPGPQALGGALSGGNQQKVALGRWLAIRPRLLILDEPTQGVDVGAKAEIHRIIRRLAKEGLAVLMISSDLPEVLGMSDRIAVMREGALAGVLPGGASAHEVMRVALGQTQREAA
jgi:rhamnose transport system ATP-binding protein